MRILTAIVFAVLFIAQTVSPAFAIQRGTPEYEKMKEYKKAQREKQDSPQPEGKAKGFWQKEAERSGFAGTAAMFSNVVVGAIPLEKPNSRKEAK